MSLAFERVAGPYSFTEGPVWDGEGILFPDIPTDRILYYHEEAGECEVRFRDTNAANGLKLDATGRLFTCEMNGRRIGCYHDEGYDVIVSQYNGDRFNSPNDLAIDEDGNLWFTDPYYGAAWEPDDKVLELDHRSVYRVDPDNPESLTRVTTDTTNPNGILVSPDGSTLYIAQSDYDGPAELRAYPITADKDLGEYETLHNFAPHRGIDGMCLDIDGNIVATAGWDDSGPGPLLYVFEPSGRILETHPIPDPLPTNCCFGGRDLQILYVTGANGCLYRAKTDREGYLGVPG